ncbi:hypothetical protein [Methylopila sp. M107]|uniref:hypothetical protein n=1 Tax=Methylopila sp. M107 TaxID=1101190 RepID=UPI00058ECA2F|nr:hypothetical protein [Methylopila sp. M107]
MSFRTLLLITGFVGLAIGLLWIGQGLGLIIWPQESFMIRQTEWALYGAVVAAVGLGLVVWARR